MRSRLTYSNVIATLALFLALGGGAVAALKLKKNSVGSAQIKPNAVQGVDVLESSLGKVPSADSLDGRDGTEIERRVHFSQEAELPDPEFTDLFTLGAFRFSARCIDEAGLPHMVLKVTDESGDGTATGSVTTSTNPDHLEGASSNRERFLAPQPEDTVLDLDSANNHVGTAVLGLSAPDQTVTGTLWFDVFDYTPPDDPPDCNLNGTMSLAR